MKTSFQNWVRGRVDQAFRRWAPDHIRHAYFRGRARRLIADIKRRDNPPL